MPATSSKPKKFSVKVSSTDDAYTARYKVLGFWPIDSITVRTFYEYDTRKASKADVSWASGGRDTIEEESGIEAAKNFANALKAAIKLAEKLDKANGHA